MAKPFVITAPALPRGRHRCLLSFYHVRLRLARRRSHWEPTVFATAILMIFPVALAFAAANDLFTMRIPNKISLVLIGGFGLAGIAAGLSLEEAGMHVLPAAAVLVCTFALFTFHKLGGGDAKLMAAASLWMGGLTFEFIVYVTIFGGVLALLILAYRKFIPAMAMQLPGWAIRLNEKGSGIPYGIAIAAAGLFCYPHTALFKALAT